MFKLQGFVYLQADNFCSLDSEVLHGLPFSFYWPSVLVSIIEIDTLLFKKTRTGLTSSPSLNRGSHTCCRLEAWRERHSEGTEPCCMWFSMDVGTCGSVQYFSVLKIDGGCICYRVPKADHSPPERLKCLGETPLNLAWRSNRSSRRV